MTPLPDNSRSCSTPLGFRVALVVLIAPSSACFGVWSAVLCSLHSKHGCRRGPWSPAHPAGPAQVSDCGGWRRVEVGTERSRAGDGRCLEQRVRNPDGWAAQGQFIPENCKVGKRERGGHRSRLSPRRSVHLEGDLRHSQCGGRGWLQGTKDPHALPRETVSEPCLCGRGSVYTPELFLSPREAGLRRRG